jgi:hypothetical protein
VATSPTLRARVGAAVGAATDFADTVNAYRTERNTGMRGTLREQLDAAGRNATHAAFGEEEPPHRRKR